MNALKAAARKIDGDDVSNVAMLSVGAAVEADFQGEGSYYPGEITKVHRDSFCDISYADGDTEARVPPGRIRVLSATTALMRADEEMRASFDDATTTSAAADAANHTQARAGQDHVERVSEGGSVNHEKKKGLAELMTEEENETNKRGEAQQCTNEETVDISEGGDGTTNERYTAMTKIAAAASPSSLSSKQVLSGMMLVTVVDRRDKVGHLPPKPRALPDLPKGSHLNQSLLKLSQRDTHPRELRAALKETVENLMTKRAGGGGDEEEECKDGSSGGYGRGGGGGETKEVDSDDALLSSSSQAELELSVLCQVDFSGWTALHWAASNAQKEVALELLSLERHARSSIRKEKERGADDESREGSRNGSRDGGGHADKGDGGDDEEGMDDDDSMPKKLVTVKDKLNGWTPLHLAAVGGSTEHFRVARVLLEKGDADSTEKDICGDSASEVVSARGPALVDWRKLLVHGDSQAPTPRLRDPREAEQERDKKHHSHSHRSHRDHHHSQHEDRHTKHGHRRHHKAHRESSGSSSHRHDRHYEEDDQRHGGDHHHSQRRSSSRDHSRHSSSRHRNRDHY